MNKIIKTLFVSQLLFCLTALSSFAANPVVISITTGESELDHFKANNVAKGPVDILPTVTGKHANDNWYVRMNDPEINVDSVRVAHRDVYVVLPSKLNANTLMEALVKIRAAKTFGAEQVTVYSDVPIASIPIEDLKDSLDLKDFVATAGADSFIEAHSLPFGSSGFQILTTSAAAVPQVVKNKVTQPGFILGSSNHLELAKEVSGKLEIPVPVVSFEDLKAAPDKLKGQRIYWFSASSMPINYHFFNTLAEMKWMESKGASVHLVSPYLPYARSDKPEFDIGVPTQGRLVADLIQRVSHGITVVHAHAPQSLGFFTSHSHEISGRATLVEHLKTLDIGCVVAPDAGAQKEATKLQQDLIKATGNKEIGLAVMNKQRDSHGRETLLGGSGLELVVGKHVIIYDDETATGGTLDKNAKAIKKYTEDLAKQAQKPASEFAPLSITAAVIHLAGTGEGSLKSPDIDRMIVMNTLPVSTELRDTYKPKLTVLSIASEIADSIWTAETNR